ncbi:MAG TPA: hypothetical protein VNJ12_00430 [Candidatus Dormibacteraeota bacterium]|nr:hypothetical protein [Candidatus Dormibacteraeota bacterium]
MPTRSEIYCSGTYSTRTPRSAGSVVSGEDGMDKLLFSEGDLVYLRLAARSAVKTGEQFLVVRPVEDPTGISWFGGQERLEKRMGRLWEDIGRVRVVRLAGNEVKAQVEGSCAPMERGDELLAFAPRTIPPLPGAQSKDASTTLSRQPLSSRAMRRVVSAKGFRQVLGGAGYIAYVDLGSRQGAKPGDRLLLFRRLGAEGVEINRTSEMATHMEGFGQSRTRNVSGQSPREVLGEGVILRVSPTAATVFIISIRREIGLGDYAGLE